MIKKLTLLLILIFNGLAYANPPGTYQPLLLSNTIVCTYPLDLTSASASGAFSLRKLKTAYAGKALQVRRASDSTTQDVGFTSSCILDTASMLTFCAATDCFVSIWYDQSGNTRNMSQGTAGNQPKIVTSGALITTFSAKGSLNFISANATRMTGSAGTTYFTLSAYTYFIVGRANSGSASSNASNAALIGNQGADAGAGFLSSNNIQYYHFDTAYKNTSTSYTIGTNANFLARFNGTTLSGYAGGGAGTSVAAGNVDAWSTVQLGNSSSNVALDGYEAEVIFFASQLSQADSNLIGNDAASYWGTAWSNI